MKTEAEDNLDWAESELLMLLAGKSAERLALQGSEPGWRRWRSPAELRAFHECGHAIAAIRGGYTVYGLTIIPAPQCKVGPTGIYFSGGLCQLRPEDVSSEPAMIESDEYRAGRLALCFAAGMTGPKWKSALRVIRQFRVKTEELLLANWYAVQKLADELERCQQLDRDQIAAILNGAVH